MANNPNQRNIPDKPIAKIFCDGPSNWKTTLSYLPQYKHKK